MTDAALPSSPPDADRVLAALRAGAFDEAERLLSAATFPAPWLCRTGEMLMRRRQWAQAAWVFGRVRTPDRDPACDLKRRLSLNLAALKAHRPSLYTLLVNQPADARFSVGATASGKPTVQYTSPEGKLASLSPDADPLAAAAVSLPKVYSATKTGEVVALCGLGDGYLAQLLAQRPPKLFMDKAQPVYLIEPEPQVVLHCLMIHDFTGPAGPIKAQRFHWFVGPNWGETLDAVLLDDRMLPCPLLMVGQGPDAPATQDRLRRTLQKVNDRDKHLAAEVSRLYATPDPAALAATFGPRPPRKPRVLLLTTRLSTVLQYSTRDTATAFERLGWEPRVLIEPTPHHRMLRSAIAHELVEFRPDLVFQIDHLRHEHHGLFPPGLPFACWVQDHLPQLATPEAGASVGPMDFVLTDATATYVDKFGYPARQCLPLPKLTKGDADVRPVGKAAPECRSKDVSFVSNASHTADAMVAQGLAQFATTDRTRELITACCRRIERTYEEGGSLPTYTDVCVALRAGLAEQGASMPAEDFDRLARWLTHPFNDALYRQQALRWAARASDELGLTLALYGKGWENHAEFARFARGPVAYGEELSRITRESLINLQIVPYLCLHQRLLDGLIAGGFFLIREHPADVAPGRLLDFLHRHAEPGAQATAAVAASLPAELREDFESLLSTCRPCLSTTGQEDLVAMVRDWEEAGQLVAGQGPLPMLGEVSFSDEATLRDRLRRFAADPSARDRVSGAQRKSVADRLTYDAGIRRVLSRMGELLTDTAKPARLSEPAIAPIAPPKVSVQVPASRWLKPRSKVTGELKAA